jgi:hypothetical protein
MDQKKAKKRPKKQKVRVSKSKNTRKDDKKGQKPASKTPEVRVNRAFMRENKKEVKLP